MRLGRGLVVSERMKEGLVRQEESGDDTAHGQHFLSAAVQAGFATDLVLEIRERFSERSSAEL